MEKPTVETDAWMVRKVRMPLTLGQILEAAQIADTRFRCVEVQVEPGHIEVDPRDQGTLNPLGPDQTVAYLIVELTQDTPKGYGIR